MNRYWWTLAALALAAATVTYLATVQALHTDLYPNPTPCEVDQ